MKSRPPSIFALQSSAQLGTAICARLDMCLARHEERDFEDGEHKIRPLQDVTGRDVYVIAALHGFGPHGVNDKLCRLLFLLGCLRDAGAARLTAVVPYLAYARKDRRTQPHDPVTTRYVAQLIEAVGTQRVMALEVHNPSAFDNAFRIEARRLDAHGLWASSFAHLRDRASLVVASPDAGGVKRAEHLRQQLERDWQRPVGFAFMEKHRSGGAVRGSLFAGEVAGAAVIVIDDMIASGQTLARMARACRDRGAHTVVAAATHAAFTAETYETLAQAPFDHIAVTNTITPLRFDPRTLANKLKVVDASPVLAQAIAALHTGRFTR